MSEHVLGFDTCLRKVAFKAEQLNRALDFLFLLLHILYDENFRIGVQQLLFIRRCEAVVGNNQFRARLELVALRSSLLGWALRLLKHALGLRQ